MATEQDHVRAMLDDMLMFLAKQHVPTPKRTYKLDGGWTLAMDDLRRFVDRLTTERDTLRAEVERLRGELAEAKALQSTLSGTVNGAMRVAEDWKARAESAEAQAQDLRESIGTLIADIVNCHPEYCDHGEDNPGVCLRNMREQDYLELQSAISRTPAQSLAALKARVYREAAGRIDTMPDRMPNAFGGISHDDAVREVLMMAQKEERAAALEKEAGK